jgi:hypothetical protein
MSKPTPGPWYVEGSKYDYDIIASEYRTIAKVFEDRESKYDPEFKAGIGKANAHLIAAAPELLEAAKRVASNTYFSVDDEFEQLRAAIAKAEGRADEKESS